MRYTPIPAHSSANPGLAHTVAVVAALLLLALTLAGCGTTPGSEPVVIEKIVEVEVVKEVKVPGETIVVEKEVIKEVKVPVEVVVEKEVIKEVVVEVVKEVVVEVEVPAPTATPVPTPVVASNGVLLYGYASSHFLASAFTEGIPVTASDRDDEDTGNDLDVAEYRGALVTRIPYHPDDALLNNIHAYVYSGGNAAVFLHRCRAEALQATFGITCAGMPDESKFRIKGRGEQFAPFWNGLNINNIQGNEIDIQLLPGQSDFTCIPAEDEVTGTFCTALYGKVREGKVIFMIGAYNTTVCTPHCEVTILTGDFHKYDHREASSRLLHWLAEKEAPSSRALPAYSSFDAASILARFSTTDAVEGETRAVAAGEIIAQYESGAADSGRVMDLLHTLAPELSIDERRRAAAELDRLSEGEDWDGADTADAVQHLAAVVTGVEVNAEGRIAAANEMVDLYEAGDLDAERALNLMDIVAAELSINERRQAAASLARLSADDDWDAAADRMEAASEVFRLVTGVPLAAEQRLGAAVDLAGVALKIFDTEGSFDDRDIDNATEIIKRALTGNLTADSLRNLLGFGG